VAFQIRQFEKADFETLWRIDQKCFDPELAYSRPELAFYMWRRQRASWPEAQTARGLVGREKEEFWASLWRSGSG
jgi:hypothetical protein